MPIPDSTIIVTGDAALLARRYAAALYELAQDQKKLDKVAEDLRGLKECLNDSSELRYIITQPRLTQKQVADALNEVAKQAKFDGLTSNFLGLIAKNRRSICLPSIIDAFMADLAKNRGEYTADVTVARPLSDEAKTRLAERLRGLAGGTVHMVVREDKELLGGLIVKVGSHLFDASLKTKLARLERQMKSDNSDMQKGAA